MAASVCGRCGSLVATRSWRCERCGRLAPDLLGMRRPLDRLFGSQVSHARILAFLLGGIFFATLFVSRLRGGTSIETFDFLVPDIGTMVGFGLLLPQAVAQGEWWRLVTPIFLHLGLMHLLFNAVSLLIAGPFVEAKFGAARFGVLFLVTGVAGNVASQVAGFGGAGASGAIFGLIGVMIVYGVRRGGDAGREIRNFALKWLLIGLAFGLLVPRVNNMAHLGGALAGLVLGGILALREREAGREPDGVRLAAIGSMLLVVVSFGAAGLSAMRGESRFGAVMEFAERLQQLQRVDPSEERLERFLQGNEAVYEQWLEQTLRLVPDDPTLLNNLAWLRLTATDPSRRDPAEALELARRAVEESPVEQASFLDTLAEALFQTGAFAEAESTEQRALDMLAPGDPLEWELRERLEKYRDALESPR